MRSFIFLPGNTPNMLINGDVLPADGVVMDLEDAVSPTEKDSARILVRNTLRDMRYKTKTIIVRINSTDTPYWKEDLDAIIPMCPDMIMPTKVSGKEMVREICRYMCEVEQRSGMEKNTVKMIPLIETAMGVEKAMDIASASERVSAMFLGAEDLTADLQCERTKEGKEIFYARSRMVCAARAAEIDVYDTPFTDVDDMEGLAKDVQTAKALGFTGKASISPRHLNYINECFSPTPEEIEYAKEVLETIRMAKEQGKGVVSLRGKMIDAPIVARAQRVVDTATAIYGGVK